MSKDNDADIMNEGRRHLTVVLKDGTTEIVTVKKHGWRGMAKLGAAKDDGVLALLYIEERKDAAWIEQLTDESVFDIVEKGDEVNDPLFSRWQKRQMKRLRAQGVDVEAMQRQAIKDFVASLR